MSPNPVLYRRLLIGKQKNKIAYIIATGGQVIRYGDWLVHEFYGSDVFDVTQSGSGAFGDVEYFGIAGGGGGGGSNTNTNVGAGGGGGGGIVSGTWPSVVGNYPITIGAGGVNGAESTYPTAGNNTTFFGLTAIGGGYGGQGQNGTNIAASNGGSGGGSASFQSIGIGLGTVGQGNNGGASYNAPTYSGGGGGGSASVGGNATLTTGGNGGAGISTFITNLLRYFGGGGGGGAYVTINTQPAGGIGGGGNGGYSALFTGTNAVINTGGGGGGASAGNSTGGTGGSGYAAVKYFKPAPTWPSSVPLPIAQWKLDGNANDSIGTNNGTATNVTWQQCKVNDGGVFSVASTSKIQISNNASSPMRQSVAITYSFWVNIPSGGYVKMGVATAGGNGSGGIYLDNGIISFTWTPQNPLADKSWYCSGAAITVDRWHYIVCSIDFTGSSSAQFYIDGVAQTMFAPSGVIDGTPETVYNTSLGDCIGARSVNGFIPTFGGGYSDAQIDEVSIFDYPLSTAQVADLNTSYYNS